MNIDQLLAELDEEFEERAEILTHIHEAVMNGELTPDEAAEVRAALGL